MKPDTKFDSYSYAKLLDENDPMAGFRDRFHMPLNASGEELCYMCGNSLGLMPKSVSDYVQEELEDWKTLGVEGHFHAKRPWMPYHEFLTESMAKVVGAKPSETVVMNSLTVNLHLMMVSFYKPSPSRHKVLVEYKPFPSDRYAVESQIRFHGFDPKNSLLELKPRDGSEVLATEEILEVIENNKDSLALVMMGGVNYYTGQSFDLKKITEKAMSYGINVGFDLAHGAGNIDYGLSDAGPDFAVWCTYKYMNSGPGGMSGCYVNERHHTNLDISRFAGWWGHDKTTRFKMGPEFRPIQTAEAWQLSNPPILPMAALRASLNIFDDAGMKALREKSIKLTSYMEQLVHGINDERIRIITPSTIEDRGCQLSIQVRNSDRTLFESLSYQGVISDWREPDVIRVAPVPLYNSFRDVWKFGESLKSALNR